jgi:hypothetical protein
MGGLYDGVRIDVGFGGVVSRDSCKTAAGVKNAQRNFTIVRVRICRNKIRVLERVDKDV